jgi:hypothetical protein
MHLLYIDESGAIGDAKQRHFVLAGLCFFERQSYWISSEMDKIAARFDNANPNSIELHGSHIYGGKGLWRKFPKEIRKQALVDCLEIFSKSHINNRILLCVVNKSVISPHDPVALTFEQLASRFDYYLKRLHRNGDSQRGIIIFDKSTYETTIQNLATDFRTIGHSWGVLRNLAEVPLFIDSRASRLIQLADLVAYAAFRNYEHNDSQLYNIISGRLDKEGGIAHGLFEKL